ncbi:MAG: hypothetical protein ABGW76_06690 [Mesonia sp.]|uniref:hypothetical protein n=1 Tax=Mesonia sp. TaxID=1960830 RepID=UPI0032429D79
METLDLVKENINRWNLTRNNKNAISYLTSGSGFLITAEDFKNWSHLDPEFINCYLAIDKMNNFKIYLADNITDENQEYLLGKNLFEKGFQEYFDESFLNQKGTINSNLTPTEADSRIATWVLCANAWVNHKEALRQDERSAESGEMVPVFTIPFSDLRELFSDKNLASLKATFALKFEETEAQSSYEIEIILAKTEFQSKSLSEVSLVKETFADMSKGYPPSKTATNQFNLL